VNIYVIFLLLS